MTDSGNAHAGGPRDPSSDRRMHTFRIPLDLVSFLKAEAALGGRDLTAQVLRYLEGIRSYCGLPAAATAMLEADRKRLGMDRFEYLLHTLYARSMAVREKGPGFDAPISGDGERP